MDNRKETDTYTHDEIDDLLLDTGFNIDFVTMKQNTPPHWHRSLEILFILNGTATVNIEKYKYVLHPLDFMVIDEGMLHDVVYGLPQTMGVSIHISKNFMRNYIPDFDLIRFKCDPDALGTDKEKPYMEICELLKDMTILYVSQTASYNLRSSALVLEILACLVENFSAPVTEKMHVTGYHHLDRMDAITKFVDENHAKNITLQDGADVLALNKDYFCRIFKENMGISFISYVNEVRISHIYQDLIHTDDSVQEIMERHGFYNQKLFYREFKDRYGCTPLKLRKTVKNNPVYAQ